MTKTTVVIEKTGYDPTRKDVFRTTVTAEVQPGGNLKHGRVKTVWGETALPKLERLTPGSPTEKK